MHAPRPPFAFPMEADYDNRGSSFFRNHPGAQLPTPDEVRMLAIESAGSFSTEHTVNMRVHQFRRPPVLHLTQRGLIVKYGHDVTIAEAHCMLFLRDYFERTAGAGAGAGVGAGDNANGTAPAATTPVPVPEVYGWRTDRRQTFIYMQQMEGYPLSAVWSQLHEDERVALGARVRAMAAALQSIPQSLVARAPFVGHVSGGPLLDWTLVHSARPRAGPFASVAAFHDWLGSRAPPHLPDDETVVLTHGNLHRDNIMVTYDPGHAAAVGSYRITAVLDWAQAGWYPAYWEDCKAYWNFHRVPSSWATKYLRLETDRSQVASDVWNLWLEMVLRRSV